MASPGRAARGCARAAAACRARCACRAPWRRRLRHGAPVAPSGRRPARAARRWRPGSRANGGRSARRSCSWGGTHKSAHRPGAWRRSEASAKRRMITGDRMRSRIRTRSRLQAAGGGDVRERHSDAIEVFGGHKKTGRERPVFFERTNRGSVTLVLVVGSILGIASGVLGSVGSLVGLVGGIAGSVLGLRHRILGHAVVGRSGGRSGSGGLLGLVSSLTGGVGSGGGLLGSLVGGRRAGLRRSLLGLVSGLLGLVGGLLGVLRGILRAVAASRQQRDERGGE